MLIVDGPRLKAAQLVEDCSALGLNNVWVPTYSARCKVNQAFANNLIAHLHGHHLHRHDSHMIARKAVVEDLEEGPHICFKEALLHIAVVGEPIKDENSAELSRRQPTIQAVNQIYIFWAR